MKKELLTLFSTTLLFTSAMALPAYAQSDGVINYSDTFTEGDRIEVYIEGEDVYGQVNVFSSSNFTFSVDMNSLMQTEYSEYANDYTVGNSVWMGVVDNAWIMPITDNPYEELGIQVKKVGDGIYSLDGLDIKEDTVYAIMVEMWGSRKSGTFSGGANAGGGGFSSVEPSFFKIASSSTTNISNTNNVSNTSNTSAGDNEENIYYYWKNNETGWWVQCSDGTYLVNRWYQSPASGLWYYMGADGYMLTNTTTPDGYYVNGDGVWIQQAQQNASTIAGNYKLVKAEFAGDTMNYSEEIITVQLNEDSSVSFDSIIFTKLDESRYENGSARYGGIVTFDGNGGFTFKPYISEGLIKFYQKIN